MKYFLTVLLFFSVFSCSGNTRHANVENLSAPEIRNYINENGNDVIILDIRTPGEFHNGHIEKAVNLDFYHEHFWQNIDQLLKGSKEVIIYCATGNRSGQMISRYSRQFDGKILHMNRGIRDWNMHQLPIMN